MDSKECFKCGEILPLDCFYRHKQMADGHLNKCKSCNKKDSIKDYNKKVLDLEWKLKERERSREKMRKARKIGKYNVTSPELKKVYTENYNKKFPEKAASRIFSQRLKPKPCLICGSEENIEGHHEDYSKPKEITWLCRKHHYAIHVEIRKEELLNGSTY